MEDEKPNRPLSAGGLSLLFSRLRCKWPIPDADAIRIIHVIRYDLYAQPVLPTVSN